MKNVSDLLPREGKIDAQIVRVRTADFEYFAFPTLKTNVNVVPESP